MSRRSRIALIAAGAVAAGVVLLAVVAVVTLRSAWFREQVRQRIVVEVERATGGRSEARSFSFDWRRLTADVRGFVLHGTEPAGKPPLFRAESITVGIKIVSLLRKQFDIESLRIGQPRIYLIVYPGGRTNVPEPKVRRAGKPVMQTILDLAVHRFELNDGVFEVEDQGKTPFHGRGENVRARLAYDSSGPRYQGDLAVHPFAMEWGGRPPLPVDVDLALRIEAARIQVVQGHLASGNTRADFSGVIANFAPFDARFNYEARLSLPDLEPILGLRSPPKGEALVTGAAAFAGIGNYDFSGNLHAAGIDWRESGVRLGGFRAEGAVSFTPAHLEVSSLRLSGNAWIGSQSGPQRVEGSIGRVTLRESNLEAAGVRLAALGGTFAGGAELHAWDRYRVEGTVAGFEARRLAALYTARQVPWNGRVSGPLRVEGALRAKSTLVASVRLDVTPAEAGPPVRGLIEAVYSARGETIDLGRSWLELPATRVGFSGVLGRELAVHVETRNLDDLLPVLGVQSLPVRLESGAAFRGTVSGKLDDPRIAGQVTTGAFALDGTHFDAFQAAVTASRSGIDLRDATLARASVQARFALAVGLQDWKLAGSSLVYGKAAVAKAAISDLLALAGRTGIPAAGTLDANAQLTGTYASPRIALEATALKGSLYDEPFDRAAAKVTYAADTVEIGSAQVAAGPKQINLKALYRHARGDFATGRLRVQASSNQIPLQEVRNLRERFPDLAGTAQFNLAAEVDVARAKTGAPEFRVADLSGDATAGDVTINARRLGNAHLAAATSNGVLTAHLNSDFAGSAIRGDGQVRLAGDYPGKARVTVSRLDFLRLRELVTSSTLASRLRVAGSLAGDVSAEGPMLRPEAWKAALNVTQLQVGPAPGSALGVPPQDFTLRNAGPVTATMAGGVLRIGQARFVGRATDLAVSGAVAFQQKNALDLRVKGRLDMATLQDFDRDIAASGFLNTDATVRGPLDGPQLNGRLEVRNASFNLATIPNGIYNANGAILFTGTRATIQNLTGESGGGKVRLAGFMGYEGDELIFRLFLRAEQVRVRYPEGVSTVANAALNWTGTTDRSTLAGTITIMRSGFNPQSDFSSILARSAEPVRTPSAREGVLSGLHFDVQIETSPDITFESSLAQDIQMEASLRLRGTGTNPSLLGRLNITQGRLIFFGTRYTINQGSISFFNPARIEPILNVDLETKARGIDITLTVSGPVNKLNLTPRSDPPLQFNEIVALLATGRAPTTDSSLAGQLGSSPQTWQQMGASALLGQAIANPVAGRLQRFFGVTRLKIDPTLAGVENNPQARLTLEQQITPNITFTYITNVTSSNPLVVQVEWAISRKWSVIAVRDENGLFGIDFLYKKRF